MPESEEPRTQQPIQERQPETAPRTENEPPRKQAEVFYCRFIRTNGLQCRNPALRGHDLCYKHFHHRRPKLPRSGEIEVPLLDDHSTIRVVLTQITDAVLNGRIPPDVARVVSYTCQVASSTLARPVAARVKPAEQKPPVEETVAEVVIAPDGTALGPEQKYVGPEGVFEPSWSISKYLYEKECAELEKAIPTCEEEYPESGWLTEEEMKEDPEDFRDRYAERKRKLRLRAGRATVRDLETELKEAREAAAIRENELRTNGFRMKACGEKQGSERAPVQLRGAAPRARRALLAAGRCPAGFRGSPAGRPRCRLTAARRLRSAHSPTRTAFPDTRPRARPGGSADRSRPADQCSARSGCPAPPSPP